MEAKLVILENKRTTLQLPSKYLALKMLNLNTVTYSLVLFQILLRYDFYIDRIQYFLYFTERLFLPIMQIWQVLLFCHHFCHRPCVHMCP